ncbi:MAG: hypothetical protein ACR2RE_28010 [Geminicoccaceae bacterium]
MSDLFKEIKQTFDLATLKREASNILTGKEWEAFQKITHDHARQHRFAKRAYELEYDERVAMARVRLINKAGNKDRGFKPPWSSTDRFDKEAINRQAQKIVRHAFLNEQVRIEGSEAKEISNLIENSEAARTKREKLGRDFERATDRRRGSDRRIPKQPRKRSIS